MTDRDDRGSDAVALPAPSRRAPIIGAVVGLPVIVFGIVGAFADGDRTKPFELGRWVIGADLAHDLILAPVVLGISWIIGRAVPPVARPPVRWAAATSGVLGLIAWPFVRGYGRNATVPSLLDRNYAVGLAVYVAIVWAVALAWVVVRVVRTGHRNASDSAAGIEAGSPSPPLVPSNADDRRPPT